MITAKELISDDVPVISPLEQGKIVLNWMEIYKISHLPIVENKELLAIISEYDILNENDIDKPAGDYNFENDKVFVFENQHIYDVINSFADNKLTLLPVLDENEEYIGSILLIDLLPAVKAITSVDNNGGIIVLELEPNNYSLTEIANIVESENGKIISLYVNNDIKKNKLFVNLKIAKDDLTSIIKSFERYNYIINVKYCNNMDIDAIYKDRYDELMNFLNI